MAIPKKLEKRKRCEMLKFVCCSLLSASNCDFVYRSVFQKFRSILNCRSVNPCVQVQRFYCDLPHMDPMQPDDGRIIWVDLEMTGLDINTSKIIEVACAITDGELNLVAECPSIVIHESDDVLNHMNEWCMNQHGKSGLLEASRKSKVSLQEAEMKVLSFVRQHTYPGKSPLGGNSVHVDKKFIDKYMPEFSKHLHYRIIDVSTIKELCRRWYPEVFYVAPSKSNLHRASEDILGSIEELKYYRSAIFR